MEERYRCLLNLQRIMDIQLNFAASDLAQPYPFATDVLQHKIANPPPIETRVMGHLHICTMCRTTFSRHETLQNHMNSMHTKLRPFQCEQCSRVFTRSGDLQRHHKSRHDKFTVKCSASAVSGWTGGCGKQFTRADGLRKHQAHCKALCKPKSEARSKCGTAASDTLTPTSTFRNAVVPEEHPVVNSNDNRNQCTAHNHIVVTPPAIYNRFLTAQTHFECPLCKARRGRTEIPSFLSHLLDHLESIHGLAFQCEDCPASFGLREHLLAHQELCKWRAGSSSICMSIQIDFSGKLYKWGCDAYIFQFHTIEDQQSHIAGVDNSPCATNRFKLLKMMSNALLASMEAHTSIAQFKDKNMVNQSALALIRREIDSLHPSNRGSAGEGQWRFELDQYPAALRPYQQDLLVNSYSHAIP